MGWWARDRAGGCGVALGCAPRSGALGCLRDFVSGPTREMRETNGLLREELEGLRRRLGRQEKMQESLVVLELEKEVGPGAVGCSLGVGPWVFDIPVALLKCGRTGLVWWAEWWSQNCLASCVGVHELACGWETAG